MSIPELQRITALRERLISLRSWRHCIVGPAGSAKRTAATEIITDVASEDIGSIFVISNERGLSRFCHLLRANRIESRLLNGQQVRELAASFEYANDYRGVNLVKDSFLDGTIRSAVLNNNIGLLVLDNPTGLVNENTRLLLKSRSVQRILWLSSASPPADTIGTDDVSNWPALHLEFTKSIRKLHIYSAADDELQLWNHIALIIKSSFNDSALGQQIIRSAASSFIALESFLAAHLLKSATESTNTQLYELLDELAALATDSKIGRIISTLKQARSHYRKVLVLASNADTLNYLRQKQIEENEASLFQVRDQDMSIRDDAAVVAHWDSLPEIDVIHFDDVILCDLPVDLFDWNRLVTNLLRPTNQTPIVIHAFGHEQPVDLYTDNLLRQWNFVTS